MEATPPHSTSNELEVATLGFDDHRSSVRHPCSPSGDAFALSRACPWTPRSPQHPLSGVRAELSVLARKPIPLDPPSWLRIPAIIGSSIWPTRPTTPSPAGECVCFLTGFFDFLCISASLSLSERRLFWLTYSQAGQGAAATPNSTFAGTSPLASRLQPNDPLHATAQAHGPQDFRRRTCPLGCSAAWK